MFSKKTVLITLREQAHELIDNLHINIFFDFIEKMAGKKAALSDLQREFANGNLPQNFYQRLHTFVNTHINEQTQGIEDFHKYLSSPNDTPKFLTPFSPTPHFVGRQVELKMLQANLQAGKHTILVNGTRGMGKTAFAQQYVNNHQTEYDHIPWLWQSGDFFTTFANPELFKNLKLDFKKQINLMPI